MGDIAIKAATNSCGTEIVLGQTYQRLSISVGTDKIFCYDGNTSIVGSFKVVEMWKFEDMKSIMVALCPADGSSCGQGDFFYLSIDLLISPSLGPIARQFGSAADYLAYAK